MTTRPAPLLALKTADAQRPRRCQRAQACHRPQRRATQESGKTGGSGVVVVGAEVILTYNLWAEAALVNGACGTVVDIIKPDDAHNARLVMVDFFVYRGPTQIRSPNCGGMATHARVGHHHNKA